MIQTQTVADFYTDKVALRPPGSLRGGGHFTVYRLEDFCADPAPSAAYSRKDFYKIVLTTGDSIYHYADQQRQLTLGQHALVFTDTQLPYRWEINSPCQGYCCLFTADFLPAHTPVGSAALALFQSPEPFFYLTAAQVAPFADLFGKMLAEQDSTYPHKYELLFHYVMTCTHEALKLAPPVEPRGASAATRLAAAFQDLLARQFPFFSPSQRLELRTAQAYADQLAVHVNYLNRTLKAVTGKTTSQLLAERLVQEARALLHHTDWPISYISDCLGFEEPTYFTQFFRKHTGLTPSQLRQV
ncbi:helix-turn-helix domain-containing protein [Hymenobacter volaticus]|uniref:Helix-turn-helix transcriptional regulator n=1 Tax=Hymenobacter volaticus TaxID=2932254 RepID=A0ABY4GFT9_9BACT|nr:helix-turn-helix domain-containing protein [Hymenobacter volaticus]UOQ69825.1 helix-turn-helix transcriptional regulator [Hymenobacter volaticus]